MDSTLEDSERTYWEQRLGEDVPLNSVGYFGLSDAYVAWLYRVRAHRFKAAVAPHVKPGTRVLDVGSGGGFYVGLWRNLGAADVTATDLTQASLNAVARRFPGVKTRQFDVGAQDTPFEPESFDAISCMDVLHHLMDDAQYERALQHFARMLRPGGMLIFTDNFLHGPEYRGAHSVSRPLVQIEHFLRGAGLRIAQRKPMFVLMNNPIDSHSGAFKFYWKVVSYLSENPLAGKAIGAALYPCEIALTSLLSEGPSTEFCLVVRP